MRLFVLCAGKGTRLWPLTKNTPKSLIDLGDGSTLLERQIMNAAATDYIDEICLITGYLADQIDAKIKFYQSQIPVTTVYNPFYDVSNNLLSLWTVSHLMFQKDFLITNGDNIYEDVVFDKIQNDAKGIHVTIDYKAEYDDDDMKVSFDENGRISRIHKEIDLAETKAESVGLAMIRGTKSRQLFADKVLELARDKDYRNRYWLEIFNSLINDGVHINFKEIDVDDWREMDFHPDLNTIRNLISDKVISPKQPSEK